MKPWDVTNLISSKGILFFLDLILFFVYIVLTSESESSSSSPSASSVLRGLKPSLLRPRMSPTLQFLPDLLALAAAALVPLPLFLHLLTARQSAIRSVRGTEMAAATTTEEFTSAGTTNSRPLETMPLGPRGDWAGTAGVGDRELG